MLFLLAYVAYGSILTNILELRSTTDKLQRQVEEARSWQAVTTRLRDRNQQLQAKLAVLDQGLPQNDIESGIVGFLQKTISDAGLHLKSLRPAESGQTSEYDVKRFNLSMHAGYHQVGRFVDLIESSSYILRIEAFEMSTADLVSEELDINMNVAFYQLHNLDKPEVKPVPRLRIGVKITF